MFEINADSLFTKKEYKVKIRSADNPSENEDYYKFRVFYPKYHKILKDENFWGVVKSRNNLNDQEIQTLFLFLQFYTFNTLKKDKGKRKPNPLKKYKRDFSPSSLISYPSFNQRYNETGRFQHGEKVEEAQIANIMAEMQKTLNLKKLPIDELYLQSVYEYKIKNYLNPEQTIDYFNKRLKSTRELFDKYTKNNTTPEDLIKDFPKIRETLLAETLGESLSQQNKKISRIVNKTYKLLQEIEFAHTIGQQLKILNL